jgi:hypothetical protein
MVVDNGVLIVGAPTIIERTVVREIQVTGTEANQLGNGIMAVPFVAQEGGRETPAELAVRDTVVDRAQYIGIGVVNTPAVVERSVVRDTRPRTDQWGQEAGLGIYAGPAPAPYTWTSRASLVLKDSALVDNRRAALLLWSSTAKVQRCSIQDTLALGIYGDGISAATTEENSAGPVELSLQDSLVQSSARAGLLLSGGGGSVRRSVFAGGVFPIALEDGAAPELEDNLFEDNTENSVALDQQLEPPPMPALPQL